MTFLILGVLAVLAIVAASQAATRMRVAAPLLLVVLGIAVSLLPFTPDFEVEPEWILAGVLPPLLYSAAVSMPTMEFRRDFRAISGLSVILVVISAVGLGFVFAWLIPGLGLAAGIALGAIISPTDAVATTIVKKLGVGARVVAVLEGESLLNDATALVLLRTAIVATAASVSFWGVVGDFAYAVAVAVVIGVVVGWLNLRIRSKVRDPAVNTAISFTIPFLASIPAELLGASGLVAAVTAGIVTGRGATKWLTPQHRLSDTQNWRTIELLLEGAVFLVMGLELSKILGDAESTPGSVVTAALLALLAIVVVLLIRAAYVVPLLRGLARSAKRGEARRAGLENLQKRLEQFGDATPAGPLGGGTPVDERRLKRTVDTGGAERFITRIRRFAADLDYMQRAPLGPKEGMLVVWAGMRGVVTLAAAQTLPADTPSRSLLVLIAFFVAAASLLIQGGTIAAVAKGLGLTGLGTDVEERQRLSDDLGTVVAKIIAESDFDPRAMLRRNEDDEDSDVPTPSPNFERIRELRVKMIHAQRERLLELQKDGVYSSASLTWALQSLDADEISLELRAPDSGE